MKAFFSASSEAAKSNSTGKTVFGLVFATLITGAAVAGMTQQTGVVPAHWSVPTAQAAKPAPVAVAAAAKTQVAGVQAVSASRKDRAAKPAMQLAANFPAVPAIR